MLLPPAPTRCETRPKLQQHHTIDTISPRQDTDNGRDGWCEISHIPSTCTKPPPSLPQQDNYVAHKMSKPLCERLLHHLLPAPIRHLTLKHAATDSEQVSQLHNNLPSSHTWLVVSDMQNEPVTKVAQLEGGSNWSHHGLFRRRRVSFPDQIVRFVTS
jgi:hypothetical protein